MSKGGEMRGESPVRLNKCRKRGHHSWCDQQPLWQVLHEGLEGLLDLCIPLMHGL